MSLLVAVRLSTNCHIYIYIYIYIYFFYSGEARGLVFWAMDPVWSPPQAPGVLLVVVVVVVIKNIGFQKKYWVFNGFNVTNRDSDYNKPRFFCF